MVHHTNACNDCGSHTFDKNSSLLASDTYVCRNCGASYRGGPSSYDDDGISECSQCGRTAGHKSTCRYSED